MGGWVGMSCERYPLAVLVTWVPLFLLLSGTGHVLPNLLSPDPPSFHLSYSPWCGPLPVCPTPSFSFVINYGLTIVKQSRIVIKYPEQVMTYYCACPPRFWHGMVDTKRAV